jgi:ParB/RepB/Spo0J family partition protein
MQLEFHQLDRRWEHLRVRDPARQRRLLASLAEAGQQVPIVVVAAEGQANHYVVIDGYKRLAALQQLGRDTVEAVVWPMGEAEALLLDRTLRWSAQETALEQGWLLQEMEQRFGYELEELARRFDRSVSWVSRRLALVELLPEAVQQQVREGKISAQVAMKYLVPVGRVSLEDCQRMAAAFAQHHWNTRQAGQLYAAWREGSPLIRQRLLDQPELFFKAQRQVEAGPEGAPATAAALRRDLEIVAAIVQRATRRLAGAAALELDHDQCESARRQIEHLQGQLRRLAGSIPQESPPYVEPSPTHHDSGTAPAGNGQARDRAGAGNLAPECAQRSALERGAGSGVAPSRESRALPPTHPGAFQHLEGEPRASP